ncbi:MAG: catalase family peroxidase [Proteobacteria bacterium]|nr:catalase family peroxidase [Pseudomonadota bacterium]
MPTNVPSRPPTSAPSRNAVTGMLLAAGVLWLTTAAADPAPVDAAAIPQEAVAALNKISGGPHAGLRANHAKGVMVTGHFEAAASASSVSKAVHFGAGTPIPVLVRFSDPTGIPNLPDADPNASPHGMAIRFTLPSHATTDIVAISASSFPVGKPEEFVQLLRAIGDSGPGAKAPTAVDAFMAAHPAAAAWAHTPRPAPESFATLAFYGVNAFKFTNAAGLTRYGRYQIIPLAGEHALAEAAAKGAAPNYLMDEIRTRVGTHPVKYRLQVQLAEAGDAVNDGSVAWPAARKVIELGTITLDGTVQDQVAEQKRILYNPLSLTDGIAPSEDPILLVRPAAYAVSYLQRAN